MSQVEKQSRAEETMMRIQNIFQIPKLATISWAVDALEIINSDFLMEFNIEKVKLDVLFGLWLIFIHDCSYRLHGNPRVFLSFRVQFTVLRDNYFLCGCQLQLKVIFRSPTLQR